MNTLQTENDNLKRQIDLVKSEANRVLNLMNIEVNQKMILFKNLLIQITQIKQ